MNIAMTILSVVAQSEVEELTGLLRNGQLTAWDFGRAGIIFGSAIVVSRVVRFGLGRVLDRRRGGSMLGELLGRLGGYLVVVFGSIYALDTLGVAVGPLLGALGIVGFALAFALQDVVENFVAGLILQATRPFNANDEIASGDYEGTVVAVDTRTITVLTPEGETVRLPSAEVIKAPIVNHTQLGRRRTTVEVGVAYGTDLANARRVILEALAGLDIVYEEPEPVALLLGFGASSIDYEVLFWHNPSIAEKLDARDQAVAAIDVAFKAADVTIPFPQRTLHLDQGFNQGAK